MRVILTFVTGRRTAWITLLGCLVAVALAIVFVPRATGGAAQAQVASAGDSQRVSTLLARFPSPDTSYALIVWTRRDGGKLTGADRESIEERIPALARLSTQPSTTRSQLSVNRTAMLLEVQVDPAAAAGDPSAVVARVQVTANRSLAGSLRTRITGTVVNAVGEQNTQAAAQLWVLLLIGVIVAALTLAFIRGLLAWIAQLVVIAAVDWLAVVAAGAVCSDLDIPLSESATTVLVTLLTFATAYFCITIVRRYRCELPALADARAGLRASLYYSAATVVASAVVLVLALLALLLARDSDARAIGVSGAIGVVLSVILALVLLPALFAVAGAVAFWPSGSQPATGSAPGRRATTAGVAAGAILGIFALALAAVPLTASATNSGGVSAEGSATQRTIDGAFGVGTGNQAIMLVPTSLGGETSTIAPTSLAMALPTVHSVLRASSHAGRTELIVAIDADPGSAAALATVEKLRARIARTGGPTSRTLVGGQDASTIDVRDAAQLDLGTVLPITAAILLVLLIAVVLWERRYRRVGPSGTPHPLP